MAALIDVLLPLTSLETSENAKEVNFCKFFGTALRKLEIRGKPHFVLPLFARKFLIEILSENAKLKFGKKFD